MPGISHLALAATGAGAVLAAVRHSRTIADQIGGIPTGQRLERMRRSPQWRDGAFRNRAVAHPTVLPDQGGLLQRFREHRGDRAPLAPVPVVDEALAPAREGLHVTWLGHASALLELDGARILLDPVWSERCSPSQHVGPKRLHPMPFRIRELADAGEVDAVVISHDHYDHLDADTITELAGVTAATFLVPLGVGVHLERWGVPAERIVELDWDEAHEHAGVTFTCVESQHFSGRGLRRDGTLWASWVIASPAGRVFFSGDTGWFDGYAGMRASYGPFDVALMAVGAYDPAWHAIHLSPEDAVRVAVDLGSPLVLPIHWGTFVLAPHPWAEPVERLLTAADEVHLPLALPRVGERVDVSAPPAIEPWWRSLQRPTATVP